MRVFIALENGDTEAGFKEAIHCLKHMFVMPKVYLVGDTTDWRRVERYGADGLLITPAVIREILDKEA